MSRAICCARRSDRPGTRACRISISCGSDGYGSQRNRHRRRRASDSSRVRLLVRITCGLCRARIVPSSGIVTCHSASTSRRNASNASSARSTSSMSSTGDRSRVIASSSGRLSRNRSLNMYASRSSRLEPSALAQARVQHLARIVPLVERRHRVEPFVALQADQLRAEHVGEHFRAFGLADAGRALR